MKLKDYKISVCLKWILRIHVNFVSDIPTIKEDFS